MCINATAQVIDRQSTLNKREGRTSEIGKLQAALMATGEIPTAWGKEVSMLAPPGEGAVQVGKPKDAEGGNDDDLAESGEIDGQPSRNATEKRGFYEVEEAHSSIRFTLFMS